jgi:hypothetical protein
MGEVLRMMEASQVQGQRLSDQRGHLLSLGGRGKVRKSELRWMWRGKGKGE